MAAAARSLDIVPRHEDRHQIADRVTLDAAGLEATELASPAQFAAFAQMLCTCAYNAAQAGDRDRARADRLRRTSGHPAAAAAGAGPAVHRDPRPGRGCIGSACTGRWATPAPASTPAATCAPGGSPPPYVEAVFTPTWREPGGK